jgi:[acyl-carrier-protein] S-malonyltransferase
VADSKTLYIFPGQGSQYVGMGSDLVADFAVAADIYDSASEIVGYDMRRLSFEDPDGNLDKTRYTQPALLTHEYACLESYRSLAGDGAKAMLVAGHSLGEYSALVAAGALSFESALKLVVMRGRLMSELGRGSMLATTLDLQTGRALADKHYCGIGGCNLPQQTVIAGDDADLDRLTEDLLASYPGKRAVRLKTEGAFHTYLMVGAAERFRPELEAATFDTLAVSALSNYTGKPHEPEAEAIRSRLFFQLFNPVRWVGCMNSAIDAGIDAVIEFGGGIGKGDGPEKKRPNLESIVKKTLIWREYEARYAAAINSSSIRAAAD